MATANSMAQTLKALHRATNKPLVLANIYDRLSAQTVAELPSCKAIATASYAIARAAGTTDDDLTLEENLAAIGPIASVAKAAQKPLTVDIQDGYGSQLEEAIGKLLDLGVSGVNLEDYNNATKELFDGPTAADRVRRALDVANKRGIPDFVINARCDVLVQGGNIDEVLERGKAYLDAGATTVFVWGAKRGVSKAEVEQLVQAFGGKLNVLLKGTPDGLSIKQLAAIGVARISVGPTLQFTAYGALKTEAEKLLSQS